MALTPHPRHTLFLKACIKTPDVGMLIAASGLTMVGFLAEFTLSKAEGLGMTEGRRARDDNCGTNGFETGSKRERSPVLSCETVVAR